MKKVSGTLKITLAQYRAQEAFAMFASDLDATTRRQLTRGERLMEILKQPQYTPYAIEDQVASVWAGTNGYLDPIPVEAIHEFEAGMLDYLRHNTTALSAIRDTGKLEDDTVNELRRGIEEFQKDFIAAKDVVTEEASEPEAEEDAEKIVRSKRG